MSRPHDVPSMDALLALTDNLQDAIASGDVGRARHAHAAIASRLDTAHEASVIDLHRARARRRSRKRT